MLSEADTLVYTTKRKPSTLSPRARRVLLALLERGHTRESVDAMARASNGPDVILRLRRRGLIIHCTRVEQLDADGRLCRPGRYTLAPESRDLALKLLQGKEMPS